MTAVCPRCNGAFESLLHALCEADTRLEEVKAGWRVTVPRLPISLTPLRNTYASEVRAAGGQLVSR